MHWGGKIYPPSQSGDGPHGLRYGSDGCTLFNVYVEHHTRGLRWAAARIGVHDAIFKFFDPFLSVCFICYVLYGALTLPETERERVKPSSHAIACDRRSLLSAYCLSQAMTPHDGHTVTRVDGRMDRE